MVRVQVRTCEYNGWGGGGIYPKVMLTPPDEFRDLPYVLCHNSVLRGNAEEYDGFEYNWDNSFGDTLWLWN